MLEQAQGLSCFMLALELSVSGCVRSGKRHVYNFPLLPAVFREGIS